MKKYKQTLKLYSSVIILLSGSFAFADERFSVLNRPVPYQGQWGDAELWGQVDYAGKDLDFVGVSDEAGSAYIDSHINYFVGLNLGLYKGLSLRYNYLYSDQKAVRSSAPKEVNVQYDGHDIRLEYAWDFKPSWTLTGQVGFRNHKISPSSMEYNVQLPDMHISSVIDIDSSDMGALLGVNLSKSFSKGTVRLSAGLEARFIEVDARITPDSSLRSDSWLGPIVIPEIEKRLPQQIPWQEQHLIASATFEWQMWRYVGIAMDFKHYQIWRENYQAQAGKQDYNSNQQFDFYLFGHVYEGLTLYGHAQIMTHYLLGEVPLTYNTTTNHKFDKAYGFVSGGLSYSF
ncbi:MAG: hypothetical protein GQ581_05170 [Methyloprofundus sp.]|nr:hypothetical protein [Methyloprofundus sp.]